MTLTQISRRHLRSDTQTAAAAGTILDSQHESDIHDVSAVQSSSPDAKLDATPTVVPHQGINLDDSQHNADTHGSRAVVNSSPPANVAATPNEATRAGNLFDGYLCLLSDSLDDLEGLRIATENRVRALTRDVTDSDGEMRGLGMDARAPEVAQAMGLLDGIAALEKQGTKDLEKAFRKHPLYPFAKATKGLGDKQTARLLATIGDPYWNDLHDRPRTVSELWAYCGYAVNNGHAQRRQRGQLSNWSNDAKMRVYLVANSCVKAGGPYREVYDDAREQYADSTHPHDCARCGPAGKPALAGSPLSLGHQHARALRRMSKAILKDLWAAARDIHEGEK